MDLRQINTYNKNIQATASFSGITQDTGQSMQVELSPYVKFRRPAGQRNIEISSIDTSSEERLQFA